MASAGQDDNTESLGVWPPAPTAEYPTPTEEKPTVLGRVAFYGVVYLYGVGICVVGLFITHCILNSVEIEPRPLIWRHLLTQACLLSAQLMLLSATTKALVRWHQRTKADKPAV